MLGHKLFQNLPSFFEIAAGPMGIPTKVIYVLNFRIKLGSTIKVRGRSGPLAFAIVGVGASVNVSCLLRIDLDRLCILLDRPVPIANPSVFPRQQEMKVRIPGITFDRMPELEHGISMIV